MKKLASSSLAFALVLSMMPFAQPAMAQTDDYARLYQEFLKRIEDAPAPNTTSTPTPAPSVAPASSPYVAPTPAPVPQLISAPKNIRSNDYSLVGKITRDEQGRYFITLTDKPGFYYRVYGEDSAKEVMKAVKYKKVQLIGEKAYFNGKHVGISVNEVVALENYPEKAVPYVAPYVAPKAPAMVETNFYGHIEIDASGHPFLKVAEGKKERAHRLVNRDQWKMAFDYSYKGNITVRGYANDKGVIRYSSISR